MIFTGIKRKSNQIFFNKKIKEFVDNSNKSTSEKVKNILVLLDNVSDKEIILENLKNNFGNTLHNIELVVFQSKVKKETIDKNIFTPKDFGWFGKIKSQALKSILTKKYDLLINYSKIDNLYNNLLILHYKEAFRVGFAIFDNRLYDLIIDCESENISLFNIELKKYLVILNKI